MRSKFLLLSLFAVGCKFGDDRALGGAQDAAPDGSLPGAAHLLITEVKSIDSIPELPATDEFVEIWNPSNQDISLANYYLTDFGSYWRLPTGDPASVGADFVVRFPAGATIASNQVITVAFHTPGFISKFGMNPTYGLDLVSDSGTTKAFAKRIVNVMEPTITDDGEYITLFYWDGVSDLVKDVDIVLAGIMPPTGPTNMMMPKMAVDGPDADSTNTAYKTDVMTFGGGMSARTTNATHSYKRRKFETGAETQDGMGNGLFGDDETSELFKSSWDGDGALPLSAATPGTVPTF